MSIAWATIALLVLLLPGVLFSVGLFLPHNVAREAVPRSALGELAATVLIAFSIHGACYFVLAPKIDTETLLAILQLQQSDALELSRIAATVVESRGRILIYVIATSMIGLAAGMFLGRVISAGHLRSLVQHGWVLDLATKGDSGYVVAYVMTHVREGNRVLMYHGRLQQFGLQKDGSFAYLSLSEPVRYYMLLKNNEPVTSKPELWRPIGVAGAAVQGERTSHRTRTILVIEGEDIANVVFEWFEYSGYGRIGTREVFMDDTGLAEVFGISPHEMTFRFLTEEHTAEQDDDS